MKKYIVCFLLIVSCFVLCGCGNDTDNNDSNNKVDESSVEGKMNAIIQENNYVIVDVRTREEYDAGHIVGSINIPYDEINDNCDIDIDKTVMVYCKSGKRSSIAFDTLKKLGYDVLDLGAYDSINLEKE